METAGIVANIINEHKPDAVMIDSIGIGAGIYSRLRELGHDNVISVRSGRRARDDKYVNKRAEMWADKKVARGAPVPDAEQPGACERPFGAAVRI